MAEFIDRHEVQNHRKKSKHKSKYKSNKSEKENSLKNPINDCEFFDDFRQTPICPTYEEIHYNLEPHLKANKITGRYRNVDSYLAIHFNLLREDLNRSLRRGINEYIKTIKSNKWPKNIKDIRIYRNVRIGKRCPKSLTVFWAKFNVQNRYIDWMHSKRLIYGSLLCLSANDFQTFCFASVAGDRTPDNLANGLFQLEFWTDTLTEEFKHIDTNMSFVMIESEVYFEAYKHNLLALQRFTQNTFPFKEYIIELKANISFPKYIKGNTVYDFSITTGKSDETQTESESYDSIKIMDSSQWPNAEAMAFDDSQYEAFRTALTRQFVLIQGPPGTGKTYVGLKVVQTLYHNKKVWNDSFGREKPIFIICYTNHALDQFLEGMLPFCQSLLRVGGRSKSKELEEYTLTALREQMKGIEYCPKKVTYDIMCCYKNMEEIRKESTQIDIEINNCRTDLLNPQELYDIENGWSDRRWFDRQMESLVKNYSNEFNLALIKWITKSDCNQSKSVRIKSHQKLEIGLTFCESRYEFKVDSQEINRIIENRETDHNFYDFGFDFDFNFNESDIGVNNTIFKTNDKTLKSISKRVLKRLKSEMVYELPSTDVMPYEEAKRISDVTQLSHSKRWRLYRLWVEVYTGIKKERFDALGTMSDNEMVCLKDLHLEKDMHLISDREIIGMTTTGAAKFRPFIERIDPKIIVIEEAAEVLESHVITSLTKNTEQLILIGDHKQLRPMPAVHELILSYNLDVSLFERMINNRMPFNQLKLQHRMRPEISRLLVPHIYEELEDHESVMHYEDIRGIKKNMFFINHSQMETTNEETKSHSNAFEAQFLIRLAKHLLYQDYDPSQITILTLYSHQLMLINQYLRSNPELNAIKAEKVDSFQGEENDIILISFVRSNHKNEIGFVKIANRVNVALSRAKKGLYCIGNFDCLSNGTKLWKQIINYLGEVNAIGRQLELKCPNHPKAVITVRDSDDFDTKSPFGGCWHAYYHTLECSHACPQLICHISHKDFICKEKCFKVLNCKREHYCPLVCHFPHDCNACAFLMEKIVAKCGHVIEEICSGDEFCYYPCEQTLECGHTCDKRCGEYCQTKCLIQTEKTVEECGHIIVCECWAPPVCYLRCGKSLSCGHECELKCSEICDPNRCLVLVKKVIDECGHEVETQCSTDMTTKICTTEVDVPLNCGHTFKIQCHRTKSFIDTSLYCKEKCGKTLICGHQCEGYCVDCNQSRLHIQCKQKCERKLICGHNCNDICGQNCPPCDQSCRHDLCTETCGQPCIRSPEEDSKSGNSGLIHKKYTKSNELYDREVGLKSCEKELSCGHPCIGLCGLKCLKYCLICDKIEIKKLYGMKDLDVSESTGCIFFELENCGHIIEVNVLKTLLNAKKTNEVFKCCPECQTIITRCQPFNHIIEDQFSEVLKLNQNYLCFNAINETKQKELSKTIKAFKAYICFNSIVEPILMTILDHLESETTVKRKLYIKSKYQLDIIDNKLNIIRLLSHVLKRIESTEHLIGDQVWRDFYTKQITIYFERMKVFLVFISNHFINTFQQIFDCEQELRFFVTFAELLKLSISDSIEDQISNDLVKAFDSVLSTGTFTQIIQNDFQSKVLATIGKTNHPINTEVNLNPNEQMNAFKD